jgi:beta-lactam-binding protein with PASTA domain
LEKAGFKVTQAAATQPTGDKTQNGHVVAQDPSSGKAKKGSTVTITVGKYDPSLDPNAGTPNPSSSTPGNTVTTP